MYKGKNLQKLIEAGIIYLRVGAGSAGDAQPTKSPGEALAQTQTFFSGVSQEMGTPRDLGPCNNVPRD